MVLLDRIKGMQQQGINETDIIRALMQGGISPKEINDALSQSKIKAAVSDEGSQEMQPSLTPRRDEENILPVQPARQEQAEEYYPEQVQMQEETPATETTEEQAFPQAYPGYEQYEPMPQAISGDIVSEIAEQIVYEKLGQIKKQIEILQDTQSSIGLRLGDTEKRLERIESIIDNLQNSFIKKIGNYGQSLEDIKTEMQGMQETFTKMVNPLMDNLNKSGQIGSKTRKKV